MEWTDKIRKNRNPNSFNSKGNYRGGIFTNYATEKQNREISSDTQNRKIIMEEIKKRCENGEELNSVACEIAEREDVKKQFDYYIRNGITDLGAIFANWYRGRQKSLENLSKKNETR